MKRILCVILAIMMLCLCGCGRNVQDQTAEGGVDKPIVNNEPRSMDGDFRYSNWGDSVQSVLDAEDIEPVVREYDNVMYHTSLFDMDVSLLYSFEDDELYQGMYVFTEPHTNYDLYIQEYKSFNDRLIEKYGEPVMEYENWTNDAAKDEPGNALWLGFVSYYTTWETDDTTILHVMASDNYEVDHMIIYQPVGYEHEVKTDGL